ncbi:MAG: cyclic pyranopterin monophosphate synthase MoaC [Candidatus Geothermarchaeales archaeon]
MTKPTPSTTPKHIYLYADPSRLEMIDISEKPFVYREAVAEGEISLRRETVERIKEKKVKKGDAIEVAKVAALQAVKSTPEIIPFCHPIKITSVEVSHRLHERSIGFTVKVKALEQTGVEMEALTGLSVALLTVWDMVKAYEKDEEGNYPETGIKDIRVKYKVKRPRP